MSKFALGNLFLLLSMVSAASSQVLLKVLLGEYHSSGSGVSGLRAWLTADRALRGGASMVLLVVGFLCWLAALSRLELSYAYPIACSSILIVALLSAVFLGEAVTPRMWIGTVLVLAGIAL
ncbi:MAG TPA: EamA family transporter, partial [Candidatus Polarisedimenticolaceae bacterium]|nr:EamA family transporter [Candidatus Polarisedimenticolaceae bacterium]